MTKEDYKIENIYQGGYSSFKPSPLSPYFKTGQLGVTTKPSPDILTEVGASISSGLKQIEIEMLSPEIVDSIPRQHTEEVRRLAKLTGAEVSVHGPVIDVSGIDQRGGFSEINRLESEKRIIQTLLRAHELNPDGNIPVNFHSAEGIPGSQLLPPDKWTEGEEGTKYKRIMAVNRETGRLHPLDEEEKYYPGLSKDEKTGEIKPIRYKKYTPEQNLEIINSTEWDNSISQLYFNQERVDEILERNRPLIQHLMEDLRAKKNKNPKYSVKDLPPEQQNVYRTVETAHTYLEDINRQANSIFSKAYKYGDNEKRKVLGKISQNYWEQIKSNPENIFAQSIATQNLLLDLKKHEEVVPNIYVKIDDFALEQSSKTFGNSAFEAYKKFGDKAPLLTIENPPAGFALSTGEGLRSLVEKSREEFAKKIKKEYGLSENEAKEKASKLIGATWDVGHINMLRKYGYTEKDIIKETEKIAPYVRHVHLSDNFGIEHTELPMGMGNVPLKEMMEKLGKKGEEAKKIIEAGVWWTQFKRSPVPESLELMGSPIYNTGVAPYWSQAIGLQQNYFGGYGMMLPQINYETWGAGFSQLPSELGGSRQQAGGRMSGRPME
ncbi:MAG: hypothetical protein AABW50_02785 [Nanoarchaeota archaeon]